MYVDDIYVYIRYTGIPSNWDNPEIHNWDTKFLIGKLL